MSPNRLSGESSPYLLQHARNPVDWYPWGPEALGRARAEDRPILLSVGYSACHWCHVMERESFEDAATAALMNAEFVCIKVDREERPDVDQIYQTAVQVLSGRGGWPLTMFLTPALEPFFGGTYYPPERRQGLAAFPEVLRGVAGAWKTRRAQVFSSAEQLTEAIRELEGHEAPGARPLDRAIVAHAAQALLPRYDETWGGFGSRPKFPNVPLLELWLRHGLASGEASFTEGAVHTLERMVAGGIYDQLGGGFARYSTDERWAVPHFEKMLYDNAQLLRVLAAAHLVSGKFSFLRAIRETVGWLSREMTDPAGGFYSTQDADSEGAEGRFFAWGEDDLVRVLGEDAPFAHDAYGFVPGGNFEHGRTVLARARALDAAGEVRLEGVRARLFADRERREKPARDDKILAGWNGLMIHGLAAAASLEPSALPLAVAASRFVARELDVGGALLRTWRQGRAHTAAFAEDHAFLAEGELALFEATGDGWHFERARSLVDRAIAAFHEPGAGFFVTRADDAAILTRPRAQYDNAVPSATSSLVHALLKLHALTGEPRYLEVAAGALSAHQPAMAKNPFAYGYLLGALDAATAGLGTLVVTGAPDDPARAALVAAARSVWTPNVVLVAGNAVPPALAPLLEGKGQETAAWLCRGSTCSLPARSPAELRRLLAP